MRFIKERSEVLPLVRDSNDFSVVVFQNVINQNRGVRIGEPETRYW